MIWSGKGTSLDGKYELLYVDPPWDYKNAGVKGAASAEYTTMKKKDIMALPIGALGSPSSVLFMWATYPTLPDALEVMSAWGYAYKTLGFQWLKVYKNGDPRTGLGWWTRANTEPCLIGVRPDSRRRLDNTVSQLILTEELVVAEIGRHSEKPPIVREKIIKLMGDLPAVELFARQRAPGWDCWGNDPALGDHSLHLSTQGTK